ncbi:hypothetical protein ABEB36_011574 [Hypothenemus hampei]|uniref:Adipokinetic hormone n=1 Tax=Hypothenemus hampei TaxID=57062 RepID=A0ABD1E8A6_HYPHA
MFGNMTSLLFMEILIFGLMVSQLHSQVTFSRNWEGAGGKRSMGLYLPPAPTSGQFPAELYFRLSTNNICQYLLSEVNKQIQNRNTACESQTSPLRNHPQDGGIFSTE